MIKIEVVHYPLGRANHNNNLSGKRTFMLRISINTYIAIWKELNKQEILDIIKAIKDDRNAVIIEDRNHMNGIRYLIKSNTLEEII